MSVISCGKLARKLSTSCGDATIARAPARTADWAHRFTISPELPVIPSCSISLSDSEVSKVTAVIFPNGSSPTAAEIMLSPPDAWTVK